MVTGASSGIGKAIALKINELGGTVIAVGRNIERLKNIKSSSKYPKNFSVKIRNLSQNLDDLPKWMLEIAKRYGKFKGLILSAGVQQIIPLKVLNTKKAKELFNINYFSNLALCKGFCDKRVSIEKGSSIVIISSIASIKGDKGIINYSASKGAINSAVKSMAIEVAKQGIRVNAVLPGFVITEMTEKWKNIYNEEFIKKMNNKYPLGIGHPADITDFCCFLVSDSAKWITGQSIVVDGGATL